MPRERGTDAAGLTASDVTGLLCDAAEGRPQAAAQLLPLVYDQLRRIAQQRMAEERPGHTLQATALVHEAYLRLVGGQEVHWAGRAQFFHAAAEAMRLILIEHARKRGAVRRGGGFRRIARVADLATDEKIGQALALDEAILRLEKEDVQAAKVVRLRFYAGLTIDETAKTLGVSSRTVKRDWAYARAYLLRELQEENE